MSPSVQRPSSVSCSEMRWYPVQVQTAREEAVKLALERRIRGEGMNELLGRIIIPTETVVTLRNGRRVERQRRLFAGYVMCELSLDDHMIALIRETPGVIDFVRSGSSPVPLQPKEASRLIDRESKDEQKLVLPDFTPGDRVRLIRGTFTQMEGEVVEPLPTGHVRVRLTILGRPVNLEIEAIDLLQLS